MRERKWIIELMAVFICLGLLQTTVYGAKNTKGECFYLKSLHYTANGMGYWYDKLHGGLENITGIPYSDLGCKKCHAASCDTCHKAEVNGKPAYTVDAAKRQKLCLKCHARVAAVLKTDKAANQEDVHIIKGMQCVDCHSSKEIHGDGIEYQTMKEPGAMNTSCEKCHSDPPETKAHTIHNGKLDCKSCHLRHVVSCTNCHFQTIVKKGKKVGIPVSGWCFLMNNQGKVTSANMQTFVAQDDKTFLLFAPANSHSIMKEGRPCDSCHGTDIVKQVEEGQITLTRLNDGKVENVKGVIPVVDKVDYTFVYQNYEDGKWIPIENPAAPMVQYVGFGTPLTQEQLKKLAKPVNK